MAIELTPETRLLFIGDSITDCGREHDPEGLGQGYVRIIRDWLLARDPVNLPEILNRGVSGNQIPAMAERWERDVLDEKPDVLSIMIGINDVWRHFDSDEGGTSLGRFLTIYEDILNTTVTALPDCRVVLCEPSVIWLAPSEKANETLKPYVKAIRGLVDQFSCEAGVPLHEKFVATQAEHTDIPLTTDGVHPTVAGHTLIARSWLEATDLL